MNMRFDSKWRFSKDVKYALVELRNAGPREPIAVLGVGRTLKRMDEIIEASIIRGISPNTMSVCKVFDEVLYEVECP